MKKPACLLLVYGLFAVLCQCVFLLLFYICEAPNISGEVLLHRYVPLLEYPLMSLALLFGGGSLIGYIEKKDGVE